MKIKNVNLVIIHGMGDQQVGYSVVFQAKIVNSLNARGFKSDCIRFEEIYWADVLRAQEEKIFERANYNNDLAFEGLRQFFVNALGDAIAYQPMVSRDTKSVKPDADRIEVYDEIHTVVRRSITKLTEADPDAPLVIVAHSLGTIVASNFIWDNQIPGGIKEPLQNLTGLITCGSPIAIWTLRYKTLGKSITFPHAGLDSTFKEKAKWLNFYDKDDIIAYPLKKVNDGYAKNVTEEKQINVGKIYESWNPMSHTGYLEDEDFTSEVGKYLEYLMS